MDTRDMILDAALCLFAQKGYAAASVRDIAKIVGIKDSSLYFHFESKQAIIDALTERFISTSTAAVEYLRNGIKNISAMSKDLFMAITDGYVKSYILDPFIGRFMQVLMHEQSVNAQLKELYWQWCIQKPVEFQTELIARLQQIGFIKQVEPEQIALAYYSPIFMYFHRYLAGGDIESQNGQFTEKVRAHARFFLKEYGV